MRRRFNRHCALHESKRLKTEAAAAVDALLPAVLDKAIKGEL